MSYQPTATGEPRPAPPAPDTPNTGRQHSFPSASPPPTASSSGLLTKGTEIVVLVWIVFDVISRVAF